MDRSAASALRVAPIARHPRYGGAAVYFADGVGRAQWRGGTRAAAGFDGDTQRKYPKVTQWLLQPRNMVRQSNRNGRVASAEPDAVGVT